VARTTVLRDLGQAHNTVGSGVMYLTELDRAQVWQTWSADPARHIQQYGALGDQALIEEVLHGAARWQDLLPGAVLSYKVEVARRGTPPPNCVIVYFHGRPRPWKVEADWLPKAAQGQASDLEAGLVDSAWISAQENAKLTAENEAMRAENRRLRAQLERPLAAYLARLRAWRPRTGIVVATRSLFRAVANHLNSRDI
jgi:hypothetical protein